MKKVHKICILAAGFTVALVATLVFCFASDDISGVKANDERLKLVKERFKFTWDAYRTNALGKDEIEPLSGKPKDHVWGGWGVTLIDSLDTLYLMGMHDEFKEASHVLATVDFTRGDVTTSFFEVTIRNLGGLLSAYDLSQDQLFLNKAKDLADVLLKAFESPSGLPYMAFDFRTQSSVKASSSSLADVGTCQLEFARLSQLTGDTKYRKAAFGVYYKLEKATQEKGMYYTGIDVTTGHFSNKRFSFGASGDSFFEYLIKLKLMLPKDDPDAAVFLRMFSESIQKFKEKLVKSCHGNHVCLGETDNSGGFSSTISHLSFFVPGMLLLADNHLPKANLTDLGLKLLDTFTTIPTLTSTGLAPEDTAFFDSKPMEVKNPHNALRPELIESLFYAYRHTKDTKYRDHAWGLFSAFDRYSKARYGYAEYKDVNSCFSWQKEASMPSYFLAETFKYFLLIFEDDKLLPLDSWVFNTEAHPFKISNK